MLERYEILTFRKPDHPVDPIFPQRWSPRAMSGESVGADELMTLFEAARWAPSCYNNQSWRFIYATRDSDSWDTMFDLLVDQNKRWCEKAAALIVVVSKETFDFNGKPTRTHSFDTGAAWMSLALQGSLKGLVVHAMAGFGHEKAREALGIPEGYSVEAMIAVGRPGNADDLPQDLREQEYPKGRKKIGEFVMEGRFRR